MKKYFILATKNGANWSANLFETETAIGAQVGAIVDSQVGAGSIVRIMNAAQISESALTDGTYYHDSETIDSTMEGVMRQVGFRKCDECGTWIAPQDIASSVYVGDGVRYCAACAERMNANTQDVYSYHRSSNFLRLLKLDSDSNELTLENIGTSATLTCGIEMESEAETGSMIRNGKIKTTEAFYRNNKHGRSKNYIFRTEEDSSLSRGVEYISNVMTKDYAESFNWSILTDQMKSLNTWDANPHTGFHIHVGKQALGATPKEQALNALKFTLFMKKYEEDFFKMSGRERNAMRFCEFPTDYVVERCKTVTAAVADDADDYGAFRGFPDTHCSAFITSGATVELRIFKSTSDPERIKHTLKLVLNVLDNIKNVNFKKVYCLGKVLKTVPQDTLNYWRARGCFIHSYANEEKGVSL